MMKRPVDALGVVLIVVLGAVMPLSAQATSAQSGFPPGTYEESFKAIFLLFVLAVVLESALAVLFNWRPFIETFNARAVRPMVSFAVAFVFVSWFKLDLVTTLVNIAQKSTYAPAVPGMLLTALVLAGGSAGVNSLLVGLGYRQQKTPETAIPKPPPTHAWIAVRLDRQQAVGSVSVFIGVRPTGGRPPMVGVINGSSRRGLRYFLNDPGRFPGSGGYQVPAGSDVSVELTGTSSAPQPLSAHWGPHTVGGGAIIDLNMTL